MNISKEIEERVDLFCVTWSFKGSAKLSELSKHISEYDFLTEKYEVCISFYQNDSYINSADNWEELSSKMSNEIWDDDESLKITINLDKSNESEFIIIDQNAFLKLLPISPEKLIKFWDAIFTKYKTIIILKRTPLKIELKSFERLKANSLFNSLEISNSISITPENLFDLLEQLNDSHNKLLSSHLKETTSLFCLKLFCSKYRESSGVQFIFEGYNSCIFDNPKDVTLHEAFDTLYTIYQWVFADSNVSSKLGMLRNLVSLSNAKKLESCFNKNLLKSLFSNYQVYMKENVKQYFEIKNKVTELMFTLLNKSFDIYDQYKTTSRNTALAVVSYFFTVIVIKAISKQNLDNLFSPEVASISLVFISSAIVYIIMIHSDLINKNKSIKNSVLELKSRYEQVLCDDEIEELFNSKVLSGSLADNSTTKYHLYVIGVLVILLACVLYFSITNLGLDYFVKLLIY